MFRLKKDWLIELKRVMTLFFCTMIFFIILFLITRNYVNESYWVIVSSTLESITKVGTAIICFIPAFSFLSVTPAGEKFNDGSGCIKTNHLPFSKKQLAWKGIKLWSKFYPIWIVIATFVIAVFKNKTGVYNFSDLIVDNVFNILLNSGVILILGIQIVGGVILSFSKNIRWYVVTLIQVISNFVLIYGSIFVAYKLGFDIDNDMRLIAIIFIGLFIISLIYFLYNLRDIEKVYK